MSYKHSYFFILFTCYFYLSCQQSNEGGNQIKNLEESYISHLKGEVYDSVLNKIVDYDFMINPKGEMIDNLAPYFSEHTINCQNLKKYSSNEIYSVEFYSKYHTFKQFVRNIDKYNYIEAIKVNRTEISERVLAQLIKKLETRKHFKKLIIHDCYLTQIPSDIEGIKDLSYLDLSNNTIDSIPKEIGNLLHLKYLDLSNNKTLTFLPEEVRMSETLQYIDISNTLIVPSENDNVKLLKRANRREKEKGIQPQKPTD